MSEICCPYCDGEHLDPEYVPQEDGEVEKYQCEHCEKFFEVEATVETVKELVAFRIEQPEEEIEPEPVDHPNQTFFNFFEPKIA
tara:strand:+ start:6918 stop:7169 length:252 start_codon:yes stop_codon:yes gene_type:complete